MTEQVWISLLMTDDATTLHVSTDPDVCEALALDDLRKTLGYDFADWSEAQDMSCDNEFTDKYGEYFLDLYCEKVL